MEIKEFDDLLNIGQVTRVVELGGHKFRLKTLNALEYNKLMERTREHEKLTQGQQFESLQRWTLVFALESIDDKALNIEEKNKILSMSQVGLSNRLYEEYVKLMEEQTALLSESKKNSSQGDNGLS